MLEIWFGSPLLGSAFRLARRLGLVSRFRDPEAAITSRLGPLALLPNYQLDAGAAAPTESAEASMNRTHLDCVGVASSVSGGLNDRYLPSYISNRSQAVATRFRFMLMNFYWLGQVRAGLSDRPDRIRRPSDRSRSRAGSLWRPPRMALLFSLRTSRPTDQLHRIAEGW